MTVRTVVVARAGIPAVEVQVVRVVTVAGRTAPIVAVATHNEERTIAVVAITGSREKHFMSSVTKITPLNSVQFSRITAGIY